MTLCTAVIITSLVPKLWIYFIFVSLIKGMIFSLHDPVKELLYIPTSESIKFKAKAWIDVFGSRFAKAAGSTITLLAFGNINRLRRISEIPALALSIFVILVTWSIGNDFSKLVETKRIVGEELLPGTTPCHGRLDGPIINGLRPGDVGYTGYDPDLFKGVFDDENQEDLGEEDQFANSFDMHDFYFDRYNNNNSAGNSANSTPTEELSNNTNNTGYFTGTQPHHIHQMQQSQSPQAVWTGATGVAGMYPGVNIANTVNNSSSSSGLGSRIDSNRGRTRSAHL
jgi:hypothetical protein